MHVKEITFNKGYYTVDVTYFYRVKGETFPAGETVTGLAIFDKRVMLFGGESRAKVFSSYPVPGGADYPIDLTANLPTAVVTAVDPLLLCARMVDCSCGNCCDCAAVTGVPAGIAEAFDEPILFEPQTRRVCISIGQFSIVRLERGTQLLIPVFDYCIPSGSCQPVGSISCSSCDDPCEMFESVCFPVDDFFLVVFFLVSVPGVVSAPSVTAVCSKFSSVIVSCSRSRCRC